MRQQQIQFQRAATKKRCYVARISQRLQAQQEEIKSLTQEQKDMSLMRRHILSQRNAALEERKCEELQQCLQAKYQYDLLIRERKALLADLDKEILELEEKVAVQNQRAVKVRQATDMSRLEKQKETLEMQLNHKVSKALSSWVTSVQPLCHAKTPEGLHLCSDETELPEATLPWDTVHFDTIVANNREMQENNEKLRTHKAILDNWYLKHQQQLQDQRRKMITAVMESTEAYRRRKEALARISVIEERHSRHTVLYKTELQERQRVCDYRDKLRSFMSTKLADRSQLLQEADKRRGMRWEQNRCSWEHKSRALKAEELAQRKRDVEAVYQRIQDIAKDGNIEEMLKDFGRNKKKSAALYNHAMKLVDENEKLKRLIKDVEEEMSAIVRQEEDAQSRNLHILQELEDNLAQSFVVANKSESRCRSTREQLDQLQPVVAAVLEAVGCEAKEILWQLGAKGQVVDENLMQCLELLEKRSKELLLQQAVLEHMEGAAAGRPRSASMVSDSPNLLEDLDLVPLSSESVSRNLVAETIEACECGSWEDGGAVVPAVGRVLSDMGLCRAGEEPMEREQLRRLVLQSREQQPDPGVGFILKQ
ncbi:coiled-coil domain-containing protein 63-like [Colius striatus]|uniref:coiled-coil domain-containing protein 63-like n=1 Tax=Colius striatus TaxID=57412 RepID=UPI002B1DB695|nr:coiled-coil domain-containing protein 63-like [Colius striatus]